VAVRQKLGKEVGRGKDNDHQKKDVLPFLLKSQVRYPFEVCGQYASKNHQKHQPEHKAIIQGVLVIKHEKHAHHQNDLKGLPLLYNYFVLLVKNEVFPNQRGGNQKNSGKAKIYMIEKVLEQGISGKRTVVQENVKNIDHERNSRGNEPG